MRVAELVREHVPSVESIGGYARIDDFHGKTEEQLRNMAAAGFSGPYISVESGDDAVLKRIGKGYSAEQAREVMEKLGASILPLNLLLQMVLLPIYLMLFHSGGAASPEGRWS